ncbi:MAG: nitroreductase family protein [Anaerolineae bacterium]
MTTTVFDLVRGKRAVRVFRPEPLPDDVVHTILEAGRLSGSAKNTQPWHFVAVQQRETLEALATCGAYAGHLAGAALGVALVTRDPFERLTVPFDLGRTTQNMMLTAWSVGVGSVMATIYQPGRACEVLGVPPEYTIPWCISFGYPAQAEDRPPRKGGRRPAAEVIHWERW